MEAAPSFSPPARPPWTLPWLTPFRCRVILAALLLLGFGSHLHYLTHDCPIDLSGDETYYWDWSRRLDLCYYSKPPMVALLIRASCAIFGDVMPAVRLPALILALGTSLCTYWLTRKLFGSDRIALGAVLLNHLVPMFIAGSVMMTIDPPMFFFWALTTCFAARAVLDHSEWAWMGVGLAMGMGVLCKFMMPLWIVGLLLFLIIDRHSRRYLRLPRLWMAVGIAMIFAVPVLIWNWQHHWVSLLHVKGDTSPDEKGVSPFGWLECLAGQFMALGPGLAIIIVGAIVHALRDRGVYDPYRRAMRFLVCMGLPYFAIVAAWSCRVKIQVNWPAPAYFSLIVLAAYFLATRMQSADSWRPWRLWFWLTVGLGLVAIPLVHNTDLLYRPVLAMGKLFAKERAARAPASTMPAMQAADDDASQRGWTPRKWDPSYRVRGWRQLGAYVSILLESHPDAIILCEKYDWAGSLAFYVKGQPKIYYVGSWFADPERRGRWCQYDLWADRQLDRPELRGKTAIFVGYTPSADFVSAFEKVGRPMHVPVYCRDLTIRAFNIWVCEGFRGMQRPGAADDKF